MSDNVKNPAVSRFRGSATRSNGAPAFEEPPMSPFKWIPPNTLITHCNPITAPAFVPAASPDQRYRCLRIDWSIIHLMQ